MIFQFDQCFNDKKLARDCKREGLCDAWCFPNRLKDKEDPVVLNDMMEKPNPLVTFDHDMAPDHTASIPDRNSGLIVITNREGDNPRTMTTPVARKILEKFKKSFPQWHQIILNNSIIEISLNGIQVSHVHSGRLVRDVSLLFVETNWATRLQDALLRNTQRGLSLPDPSQ